MARSKQRTTGDWREEAVTLVEQRTRPPARRLLELISLVNPTERGLSKAEETQRYKLKSQLQSLLVVHFPDEVVVTVEPGQDGVVGLRHSSILVGAAHAVVAELDEEARSRVRFLLDTKEVSSLIPVADSPPRARATPEVAAPEAGDVEGLLAAGRRAQEEYDYEMARSLLTQAFGAAGGDARTALPLLELVVDALADDAAALELEGTLSPAASDLPSIKLLLALAAARLGQMERALAWLPPGGGERIADVVAVLARRAMESGSLEQCEQLLADARKRSLVSSELVELQKQATQRRETERAPLEAEAQRALEQGQHEVAQQHAQAILARWPESRTARLVLERVRAVQAAELAHLNREKSRALITQAREAIKNGRWDTAGAALDGVAALDEAAEGYQELRAAVREHVEADRAEREVSAVMDAAARAQWGGAIKGYLAMDRAQRRKVRDVTEFRWLEELGDKAARLPAEDVVVAFASLREALKVTEADPEAALRLMERSWRVLADVGEAKKAHAHAAAQVAQRREEEVCAELPAVQQRLAEGDADTARAWLERARASVSSDAARAGVAGLEAALRHFDLQADFLRHRDAGELLDAAATAELLAAGADAAEWTRVATELRKEITRDWRVRVVDDGAGDLGPVTDRAWSMLDEGRPGYSLTEDGTHAVLVTNYRHHLFIRVVRVADSRLRRIISMRTPLELVHPEAVVHADVLTIASPRAAVLRVNLSTGAPTLWRHLADLLAPLQGVEGALPLPDGRHVWFAVCAEENEPVVRVVDAERWSVVREMKGIANHHAVAGLTPDVVFVPAEHVGDEDRLCTPRGGVHALRVPPQFQVTALVRHPARESLVFFGQPRSDELPLQREVRDGTQRLVLSFPDVHTADTALMWGPAGPSQVLLLYDGAHGKTVVRLECEGGLREVSRLVVGKDRKVLQDVLGRHGVLACATEEGVALWPAHRLAPENAGRTRSWRLETPNLGSRLGEAPRNRAMRNALMGALSHEPDPAAFIASYQAEHGGDPEAVLDLAEAFSSTDPVRAPLVEMLAHHFPTYLDGALLVAEARLAEGRLEEAQQVLENAHTGGAQSGRLAEWLHLLGVVKFRRGELAGARRDWTEAAPLEIHGQCVRCLPVVTPLAEADNVDQRTTLHPTLHLRLLLRDADLALARGDGKEAARILDHWLVFGGREVQSAARLAQAALMLDPKTDVERVRKTRLLAWFTAEYPPELPFSLAWDVLPDAQGWPDSKVLELRAQAQAWLDEA